MDAFQLPTDEDIEAAFNQGQAAVIALFHRTLRAGEAGSRWRLPEGEARAVRRGDIYWAALEAPDDPQAGAAHPQVVIQEDVINRSRVRTVVVCALTTNRKRAGLPGNVLLEAGEANLPRQSVVEVSKVCAVNKARLGAYIGSLSEQRIQQILAGMQFLQVLTDSRPS